MTRLTYAIGDVHGRSDLLRQALAWIEADAGPRPARVVLVGDYVDRGPDSKGVIETLMRGPRQPGHEWVPLKGNHDAMLVAACAGHDPEPLLLWFANGGVETLESYAPGWRARRSLPEDVVPAEHVAFLRDLPCRFEDETRIFVHAGLRPGVPLEAQDEHDMLWIRHEFLHSGHDFGKLVVHGHTPNPGGPELLANRLNLDTGAVWTGRLTVAAFDPDARTPRFFRTD